MEYSANYSKTPERLWKCCTDDPNATITDSQSFKFKARITGGNPPAGNATNVEAPAPIKHLGNFCRTLEMPLINSEINLILTG